MKQVVVVAVCTVLAVASAAGYPGFESDLIETSQQIAQLELDLSGAEKRVRVVQGDPYAAPLERAEASDALVRARVQLERKRLELRKEAFRLWTDVLTAEAQLEAARAAEKVMEVRLRAAQVRVEKGVASQLDLDAAARAYEQASLRSQQALAALEAARAALLARSDARPEAVPQVTPPETLDVNAHPDLQLAILDVRAAERAVAAAAGPDTSRLELERRGSALQSAQERVERLRERLQRQLETLRAQHARQRRLAELAGAAVEDAQKKLEARRLRWDQGLASQLDLLEAEQALAQARADRVAARVELGRLGLELWAYAEAP